jgi:agmatinase
MARALNFGDLAADYSSRDGARIVIVPVPYDATSTWQIGAAKGPAAIIEASAHMELYDAETDSEVYKKGIFTDEPVVAESGPEAMVEAVEGRVSEHISSGKFVVVVGGEHSVSVGAIKAHCGDDKEVTVLQLDAHCDLRDSYDGSRFNHACVMARARETAEIVQVGIRSMDVSEKAFMDAERVFFARDIRQGGEWIDQVVSRLGERVYVTIDVDVFDPSIMPSTGTPEPGGMAWYDVLGLLRAVTRAKEVVGFDVVELCPNEHNKAPDFMAAKLIYKLLSYKFRG